MKNSKKVKKPNFAQINQSLKPGQSSRTDGQMVCITNGKEVLRLTQEKAKEFFFEEITDKEEITKLEKEGKNFPFKKSYFKKNDKYFVRKDKGFVYCEKHVWKQYIDHLKNPLKNPMPKFSYEKKVWNEEKKDYDTVNLPKYV